MTAPRWQRRFRAPLIGMPEWARDRPDRCSYVSNASGTFELYTWDRSTGVHTQATQRPTGTGIGSLTPDGEELWWFDDIRGNEKGVWRTQPFGGAPGDELPATALSPGYPTGFDFAGGGRAAVGLAADGRHRIFVVAPGEEPLLMHEHGEGSGVAGWSRDGSLLAYNHAEHGDNRNRALRVVTADGATVADLWDGEGLGLVSYGWSPVGGDQRLLIAHERRASRHPAVWSPTTGEVLDITIELDGELLDVDWYPEAAAVLVATIARGRGHLFRHELASGQTIPLETGGGMLIGARVRPDGELWWAGSTAGSPLAVHCGDEILRPPGDPAPKGVDYEDILVDGPGGPVHGFLALPPGEGPFPTVFRVHGGPAGVDADAFTPGVQAWVDHGYSVVLVNYRGSTGYGKAWQDAIVGKPGYRELEDLAAVRAHVVEIGVADPSRLILYGGSWGGYLTLLGVGTQPDLWSLGIAAVPLASLRDHYYEQGEILQAYWRSLFGGTPETLGKDLDDIDPIAHVARIQVPVFVLVGDNDPRCPLDQVLTYVKALEAAGVTYELYRYDAGHGSMVTEELINQMALTLDFAARHLATTSPISDE
ncbi:MAG: prolyl oligopeptidase family serine peptidase [Actinobacteria bacterium]|nr:prolyl oligopeptidase family serine peptidase [Actinomycetota bacterium]